MCFTRWIHQNMYIQLYRYQHNYLINQRAALRTYFLSSVLKAGQPEPKKIKCMKYTKHLNMVRFYQQLQKYQQLGKIVIKLRNKVSNILTFKRKKQKPKKKKKRIGN
eukprot:TRINITY_DN8634_c0_g1_i5.p7 TRINITY_DN8634_c0_g1~~TRINITY_DN8634_c0_g1_i5.p7  ORF type:complete len:107 (+),score=2.12 TRINITY_DN8634_c0_g1_i5:582-902(+)